MSRAGLSEHASASASSSSHSPPVPTPPPSDELDDDNGSLPPRAGDDDVLDDDPAPAVPLSFKRKPKLSTPSRFLSLGASSRRPDLSSPRRQQSPAAPRLDKGAAPLDWHSEGPGRRVGYEDLTAIDWIFEYTKERQRLRALSSARGLLGYFKHLLDASQVWVVLILTGLLVGAIAAAIDITTDWLADLKLGFCSSGPEGGHFYLNKSFCCYGYDQGSNCLGWKYWSDALGVHGGGGKWLVEYVFFLIFSVRRPSPLSGPSAGADARVEVTLAYCAALLVQEYAIHAKHSGIPEIKTILGGFVIRRLLGTWTLITKSLGLVRFSPGPGLWHARSPARQILAVGSGMWLGKEGPLVHVACCCANLFIKLFGNIRDNEGEAAAPPAPHGRRLTRCSSQAGGALRGRRVRHLGRVRLPHRRRLVQSRGSLSPPPQT